MAPVEKCTGPDCAFGARVPHRQLEEPGLRALPGRSRRRMDARRGAKGRDSLRFVMFAGEPF